MWNLSSPVDKSNEFDVDNKYTTTIFLFVWYLMRGSPQFPGADLFLLILCVFASFEYRVCP